MVEKAPQWTANQIKADLQTQGITVSTRTIRHQLDERGFYGRRPRRTPLLRERDIRKPDSRLSKHTWTKQNPSGRMSCGQMRRNGFLVNHITENKMKPLKKRTPSLQSNMEEVQWCFGVAVLPLALGALNMCMSSWNQEITKVFWSAMFNPVSESCVSVKGHRSCSRTMTPSTLQKAPRNGSRQNSRLFWSGQQWVQI